MRDFISEHFIMGGGRKPLIDSVLAHYSKPNYHPEISFHKGFTLAEVLITLGIIGVVASMTIPTLMTNISNRQFETGAKKTEATLIQALLMMKANNALVGHETTENFVSELKNYLKIAKTCKNDDLSGCYPKEFTADNESMTLNDVTTSESLGQDWGTNVEGFVLNNGTSFLTAYNPNCTNDSYRACAAFIYDLNSIDKNNHFTGENGKSDLGAFNAGFVRYNACGENVIPNADLSYGFIMLDGPSGTTDACIERNMAKLEAYCESKSTAEYPAYLRICTSEGCPIVGQPYCEQLCIASSTLINLADGSHKAIEDISYDDDLLVWDFDNGRMSSAKPAWIKQAEVTDKYNLLTFSDGTQLKTINQHRIFNKDLGKFTYPMTDETPLGTTTLLSDGREVQLVDKKVVYEPVEFYNLITANHFNCFASNVLTSNRFNNLYPIVDYKFVKDNRELTPYSEYENFVSREWYEKLRLAEQTCDEDMKLYLSNLVRLNKRQPALV